MVTTSQDLGLHTNAWRRPQVAARARRSQLQLLLEFSGAALISLMLLVIGAAWPNAIWAVPALFLYLWYLTIYFRIDVRSFVLILPVTITTASSVVALVLIEQGVHIPELGRFGTPGNYTLQFVLYDMLFMLAYLFAYKALSGSLVGRIARSPDAPSARLTLSMKLNAILVPVVIGVSLLCLMAMIGLGLVKGFPLLTGTDRFVFRRSLGNGPLLYILNLKPILALLLGMVPLISGRRRAWVVCGAIMTLLTVVFFLFGDKFFTILTSLAFFVVPWLYVRYAQISRRLPIFVALALLATAPSWGMTWLIYSNGLRLSNTETLNKLSGRVVGQGELWFAQSHDGANAFQWNDALVDRNLHSLVEKDADLYALNASIGPNYYSDRYAPPAIALSIHHNAGSVTYTSALEPLGLLMFGWGGLGIVKVLCGLLAAVVARYTAWAIDNRSLITGTFAAYIYTQMLYTLRQGSPWVLFSIYSLKWMCVIAAIELLIGLIVTAQRSSRA